MFGKSVTRRAALTGLGGMAATGLGGRNARAAEPTTLTVLTHEVMKGLSIGGPAGNLVEPWEKANNAKISWITLDVNPIGDRLAREASLNSTTLDVAYLFFPTSRVLSLLEPLEPFAKSAPIDGVDANWSDFPPTLVHETLKYEGSLRALPMRISSQGMIYNEAIFEERGIKELPKTFEELVEVARKCTYTRADGTKVAGLLFQGSANLEDGWTTIARCFGGDYMLPDNKILANQPGTVKMLETLAQLYKEGVLAQLTLTATPEDINGWQEQGRAAITVNVISRLPVLNNPKNTNYPGKIKVMGSPMVAALAKENFAPTLQSWSFVMPKTSDVSRKKLAWSFIQYMSSKENTVKMALNGNGPARISAYADPRISNISFMPLQAKALQYGRTCLPSLPNVAKINSIFVEESQLVMLGRKTAQQAMDEAVTRVKPLI